MSATFKMGPLKFEDFLVVELIYLIQNIWILSDGFDFDRCLSYVPWSIEVLKRKWVSEYIDFDFFSTVLWTHNKQYIDLDQFFDLMEFSDREKLYVTNCINKSKN